MCKETTYGAWSNPEDVDFDYLELRRDEELRTMGFEVAALADRWRAGRRWYVLNIMSMPILIICRTQETYDLSSGNCRAINSTRLISGTYVDSTQEATSCNWSASHMIPNSFSSVSATSFSPVMRGSLPWRQTKPFSYMAPMVLLETKMFTADW